MCCGKFTLAKAKEAPEAFPFPQRAGRLRGTPEHHPITDFENTIYADERGKFIDLMVAGDARGYGLVFKTGKQQFGGEAMFQVRRSTTNLCLGLCKLVVACLTMGKACSFKNGKAVEVLDADGETLLGSIVKSSQNSKCSFLTRNRFNAKAKAAYDILDADGDIRYSVVVPVFRGKFLHCITAFYDYPHLVIVPGPLTDERNRGAEEEGSGWVVELRPKNEHFIDKCYKSASRFFKVLACLTAGLSLLLKQLLRILETFIALLRTCPINDLTQVMDTQLFPQTILVSCIPTLVFASLCLGKSYCPLHTLDTHRLPGPCVDHTGVS